MKRADYNGFIINSVDLDLLDLSRHQINMENRSFSRPLVMIKGNWNCSQCGKVINELPFEPDGEKPLFCRDCHKQRIVNRPPRRY